MGMQLGGCLLAAMLLAGCGGGGSGGDATQGTRTSTALEAVAPTTGTFTGTVDFEAGYTEALTGTAGPIAIEGFREFDGTQVFQESWRNAVASSDLFGTSYRSVQFGTALFSRDPDGSFSGALFHEIAPVRIHGVKWQDGTVTIATPTGTLPPAGRVGDRGDFFTYVTYTDIERTMVAARGTTTWSIEADTAQAVFLCFDTTEQGDEGTSTSQECAQAGATGHFNGRGRFVFHDANGARNVFNRGP